MIVVLRRAFEILEREPTVIDLKVRSPPSAAHSSLQGTVTIVGDLHGQADSLISLLSTVELPPNNVLLFLGNYAGGRAKEWLEITRRLQARASDRTRSFSCCSLSRSASRATCSC